MSQKRKGLSILGVCLLAALGIMAFSASAAQAAGEWLINGKTLVEKGILSETVTGEKDPLAEPELLVPGIGIAIFCNEFTIVNGKIERLGKSKAALTFSECEVLEAPDCEVTVAPATAKDQVELMGTEVFDIFSPEVAGGNFTTITIEGEFCPFEFINEPVRGSLAVRVPAATPTPLIEEYANQALFSAGLFFGNEPAELDGAVLLELSGANSGQPWTAH